MLLASNDVGQAERVRRLKDEFHLPVKAQRSGLVADYQWFAHGKSMGIELKVGSDLLGSMADRRLAGQCRKMVETLDFPLLLLVGRMDMIRATGKLTMNGHETGWDYRSVMGRLAVIQMLGIQVEQWAGDATERVASWYMNSLKEEHSSLKTRTRPEVLTLDPAYNDAIWALSAYSDIGPALAEELLKKFKSVPAVTAAAEEAKVHDSARDFAKGVKGLGPVKAAVFIEEVTRRYHG